MLVSVFTPSHDTRYLDDCYESLRGQTLSEWEWVVLLNGGAKEWRPPEDDDRVRILRGRGLRGVGAVKAAACDAARGDVLVELDHDDILTPRCLERVAEAFTAHGDAVFVYSDFAQVNADGSPNTDRFDERMGWEYSDVDVDGTTYLCCHAMEPLPHNIGYIWYAPNHVRAFRREAYLAVGGYNRQAAVLDDHDLMIRLFFAGDFVRVPECLYFQRFHGRNTQSDASTNAFIQEQTTRYYRENIEALCAAWSRRRGLGVISLRTADTPEIIDIDPGETVFIDGESPQLPQGPDSVGLIKAVELLQRVPARAALFNECYRVLVHGGVVATKTPSTDGRGAFQDPSHVSFYNENSFWYLTQLNLRRSIPDLTARLQIGYLKTYFPSSWEESANIPYVEADLLAVKDGVRLGGPLLS